MADDVFSYYRIDYSAIMNTAHVARFRKGSLKCNMLCYYENAFCMSEKLFETVWGVSGGCGDLISVPCLWFRIVVVVVVVVVILYNQLPVMQTVFVCEAGEREGNRNRWLRQVV